MVWEWGYLGIWEWDYLHVVGGVAYLCEQCRPQVGAVSTGNLCGAAYKLLCESHEGNKLRGNKVLQKTSLEENSG